MKTDLIRLKVCGLREYSNILEVCRLKPDYIGVIFYRRSKRYVGKDFMIPDNISPAIEKVGVFVNDSIDEIVRLVEKHNIDYAQLHGNEPPEQCGELRKLGIKVIKAFQIGENFSFDQAKPFEDRVDYFLFDSGGMGYGGTGIKFNWKNLEEYNQALPFFLSGGISAVNVGAVQQLQGMNLHAIDCNSGVELRPGFKDIDKIRDLQADMTAMHEI